MQRSTDILLVQPPMQHPAVTAPAVLQAAAALRERGRDSILFHAGADFSVNYLMIDSVRGRLMKRVRERLQNGEYQWMDGDVLQRAQSYAEHPPLTGLGSIAAKEIVAAATSTACSDPRTTARSMHQVDEMLRLASVAYSPTRLDRRGFSHPGIDADAALQAYLENPEKNPFLEYANRWCRPTIAIEQCVAVVLIVSTEGQMAGALTLARCWKEKRSSLKLAICAVQEHLQRAAHRLLDSMGMAQPADGEIASIVKQAITGAESLNTQVATGLADEKGRGRQLLPQRIRSCRLQPEHLQDLPGWLGNGDGDVIVWCHPKGALTAISQLLFQAAKRGNWNHLVLSHQDDRSLVARLEGLAGENPYIVHSWCRCEKPASTYSDAIYLYPEGGAPYGQTVCLPGRPLWQRLQDPVYLQACVEELGAKRVAQQRLSDDGRAVAPLGRRIVYQYMPPRQLPPGYLDEICLMVEAGGTVGSKWLRHNLERAFLIGYAEENGIIVGNSSLKHPREEYVDAVSEQCGIDLRHYLERGYTSVRPEYRSMGIGAKLLEGLTERSDHYKVYSVIAEDNVATQKMAIRNRTRMVASFFSQRTQKQIGIWIPDWMLPQGMQLPRQPDLQ